MKFFFVAFVVFVAALELCSGSPLGSAELTEDLYEFIDLIPIDETNEIVNSHIEDEEFITYLIYVLYGDEFKSLLLEAESLDDFRELLDYMEDSGFEMNAYMNALHEAVGLPPMVPGVRSILRKNLRVSVKQIRDEVRVILPQDDITALHNTKLATSPAFKYFAERLDSQELKVILEKLDNNEDYQRILETLLRNGVDMYDSVLLYEELFGFKKIVIRP